LLSNSFYSIYRFFGIGLITGLSALSFVIVSAENKLLNPVRDWYSEFRLPVEIPGTGLSNSIDESFYLAKTKVDSVVANPGAGPGTPFFDPYANVLGFTEIDLVVIMILMAVVGAAISLPLFIASYRYSKKNPLMRFTSIK